MHCPEEKSAISYYRAASDIITAEQYRVAVLVFHSFSQERVGWIDYQVFTCLFGVEAELGLIQRLGSSETLPFFGVWVVGNPLSLES